MKTSKVNHVEEFHDDETENDYLFDITLTVVQSTPSEMHGVTATGSEYPALYITDVEYEVEQIISYTPPQYFKVRKTERTDIMADEIINAIDLQEAL